MNKIVRHDGQRKIGIDPQAKHCPAANGSCLKAWVCRIQCEVVCSVELREARVGQVHLVAGGKPCRHAHNDHDKIQFVDLSADEWLEHAAMSSRVNSPKYYSLKYFATLVGI